MSGRNSRPRAYEDFPKSYALKPQNRRLSPIYGGMSQPRRNKSQMFLWSSRLDSIDSIARSAYRVKGPKEYSSPSLCCLQG
jgi:hypothetical protein